MNSFEVAIETATENHCLTLGTFFFHIILNCNKQCHLKEADGNTFIFFIQLETIHNFWFVI